MVTNLNESNNAHKACIIWMHGLGSNGKDLSMLAEQPALAQLPIKHLFLDAPLRAVTINGGMQMPAWYDIYGTSFTDREDREGILQSATQIKQAIASQKNEGFTDNQIFLAGFSQGGAIALYTALTEDLPLAGVIALSAYIPMSATLEVRLPPNTPIFLAAGQFDHLVLPAWTKQVANYLSQHEFKQITLNEYPMEHAICLEEIQALAGWLSGILQGENT